MNIVVCGPLSWVRIIGAHSGPSMKKAPHGMVWGQDQSSLYRRGVKVLSTSPVVLMKMLKISVPAFKVFGP